LRDAANDPTDISRRLFDVGRVPFERGKREGNHLRTVTWSVLAWESTEQGVQVF
jgi:hypothetical protein